MLIASDLAQAISAKIIELMGLNFGRVGSGGSTVTVLNKMLHFSSADLANTIEEFTEKIIDPALHNFQLEWDRQRYEVPGCLEFSLVAPVGVGFAATVEHKGLHVRVVRCYDVGTDSFPCRVTAVYR